MLRIGLGMGIRWLPRPAWQMPWSFGTQIPKWPRACPTPPGPLATAPVQRDPLTLNLFSDLYLFWS